MSLSTLHHGFSPDTRQGHRFTPLLEFPRSTFIRTLLFSFIHSTYETGPPCPPSQLWISHAASGLNHSSRGAAGLLPTDCHVAHPRAVIVQLSSQALGQRTERGSGGPREEKNKKQKQQRQVIPDPTAGQVPRLKWEKRGGSRGQMDLCEGRGGRILKQNKRGRCARHQRS